MKSECDIIGKKRVKGIHIMERLFSADGAVMHFLTRISDLCIISFLWLLCCLPLITIGASTTAAYYAMVKVVRKEKGTLMQEFFKSFRQNLKDSMIINAIYLVITGILIFNIYSMYQRIANIENNFAFQMLFIYIALLLLMILIGIYTYPVLSRFQMNRFTLIKFSILIMFRHFPTSLLLLAVFLVSFVAIVVCPFGVIFVPGVCLYIYSSMMEKVLRKYMSEEMLEQWDAENEEV